jgi:hypothetical protein
MAVDEGRGGVGTGVQMVAVHRWRSGGLQDLDVLEPGVAHELGRELRRAAHVGRAVGVGRDRRDAEPLEERLDDAVLFRVDVLTQLQLRHAHDRRCLELP